MSVPEQKMNVEAAPPAGGGVVEQNLATGTVAADRLLQDKRQAQDTAPALAKSPDFAGQHRATLVVVQGLETLWRSFDNCVKAAGSAAIKADRLWAPVIAALSLIFQKCKQDDETMPSHLDVAKRLHAAGHIQSESPVKQNASPYVRLAKLSHSSLWSKDAAAALARGVSIQCADGENRVFPTPVEALRDSGLNFTAVDAAFSAAVAAARMERQDRDGTGRPLPAKTAEEATARAVKRMEAVSVKYTTDPDEMGKVVVGKVTIGTTREATVSAVVALLTPWHGKLTVEDHKAIKSAMGKAAKPAKDAPGAETEGASDDAPSTEPDAK